jgi:dephospho-CoA kinase
MLQIGLTGGIGSGKSTVSHVFHLLKVPVYSADQRAKALITEDPSLKQSIQSAFGQGTYHQDGSLNRQFLANQVFTDSQALAKLNELVHPAVRSDYYTWLQRQKAAYVLHEAALILEAGFEDQFDAIISVSAPETLRKQRVQYRDNLSADDINARINRQYSQTFKNEQSDHVITNDGHNLLIPPVWELDKHYKAIAVGVN